MTTDLTDSSYLFLFAGQRVRPENRMRKGFVRHSAFAFVRLAVRFPRTDDIICRRERLIRSFSLFFVFTAEILSSMERLRKRIVAEDQLEQSVDVEFKRTIGVNFRQMSGTRTRGRINLRVGSRREG